MLDTLVRTYVLYSIIRRLVRPFNKWEAFETGVIDENGKILISKDKRTSEQKASLTMLDVFVLNMKKLLARLPGGSSRFATYAAAMFMLRENLELKKDMERNFKQYLTESEDSPISTLDIIKIRISKNKWKVIDHGGMDIKIIPIKKQKNFDYFEVSEGDNSEVEVSLIKNRKLVDVMALSQNEALNWLDSIVLE